MRVVRSPDAAGALGGVTSRSVPVRTAPPCVVALLAQTTAPRRGRPGGFAGSRAWQASDRPSRVHHSFPSRHGGQLPDRQQAVCIVRPAVVNNAGVLFKHPPKAFMDYYIGMTIRSTVKANPHADAAAALA